MRRIHAVTVARSDFGILAPVIRSIHSHADLEVRLLVSGAHLAAEFGGTVDAVMAEGFTVEDRIPMLLSTDSPEAIGISTALGIMGFSKSFARARPDILLVVGDRFEMFAAVVAALQFKIPVAHIHGGELTEGAIDDALRHSMTKLSHLHFVTTPEYAARVKQMGEEPWRVVVTGAPALDHLREGKMMEKDELCRTFNVPLDPAPLLVTFHPVTLEFEEAESQTLELLAALSSSDMKIVFTQPNADIKGRSIARLIHEFQHNHPGRTWIVTNFGVTAYFSMLRYAAAMVGNSSSGLIEAPSVGLPVVNIGDRQKGRVRGANVIDVKPERGEILAGIRRAVSPSFRTSLKHEVNPYDAGEPAGRLIAATLSSVSLNEKLVKKEFRDY